MKLEFGKRYRLRNGQTTGPARTTHTAAWPFAAEVDGTETKSWTGEGRYADRELDHPYDIVAEDAAAPTLILSWDSRDPGREPTLWVPPELKGARLKILDRAEDNGGGHPDTAAAELTLLDAGTHPNHTELA